MTIVDDIREAATHVGTKTKLRPSIAIVLGSGLGGFADALTGVAELPYQDIPHFPSSSVQGHKGRLLAGTFEGVPLFVMAGRVHAYEGYSATDVVFPARVLATLGIKVLLLTNAAGAVNTAFKPGELMVITDHINLSGLNPLVGPELPELGQRFTDLSAAYDVKLAETCDQAARRIGLSLRKGVYAGLLGPSFETPAEIRMLRALGADAVGMSTVLETIAANQMGVRVLGISCMTNMAAGILPQKINHQEVMAIGRQVQSVFIELMTSLLPAVHKQA
jgi:purine-nucleoside phosphorylase